MTSNNDGILFMCNVCSCSWLPFELSAFGSDLTFSPSYWAHRGHPPDRARSIGAKQVDQPEGVISVVGADKGPVATPVRVRLGVGADPRTDRPMSVNGSDALPRWLAIAERCIVGRTTAGYRKACGCSAGSRFEFHDRHCK